MGSGPVVIVGGTSGIGKALAAEFAGRGRPVVLTGRNAERASQVAKEIGGDATGVAVDLGFPDSIAEALKDIDEVGDLVVMAIERDANHIATYDLARAQYLVTMKLVGYPEVIHALRPRFANDCSVVLFGGLAKERPYDGSTTVSTVNGGISGLVRSLACELAPTRVNAIHPGIVGDSPYWIDKPLDAVISRTPIGRLITTREVVDATVFLLECTGMNGADLFIDGGWLLR